MSWRLWASLLIARVDVLKIQKNLAVFMRIVAVADEREGMITTAAAKKASMGSLIEVEVTADGTERFR